MDKLNHVHRLGLLIAALAILANSASANVEHREKWKPEYTTKVLQAPPPPNVDRRVQEFSKRNSPKEIEKLARKFFSLINLKYGKPVKGRGFSKPIPEFVTIKEKLAQGDHQGALDAYKRFVIRRWKMPDGRFAGTSPDEPGPRAPETRYFVEFLNQPEELMNNIVTFAVYDKGVPPEVRKRGYRAIRAALKSTKKTDLKLNIGEPGKVNWTYFPEDYYNAGKCQTDETFAWDCYGHEYFFCSLLRAYRETRDPKYLNKWAKFVDGRYINWARDGLREDFSVTIRAQSVGNYTVATLAYLQFLAMHEPNFERDVSSATLARILLRMWSLYVPQNQRLVRIGFGNRAAAMYPEKLFYVGLLWPEFKASDYLVRERRRAQERFATTSMLLDGTDLEWSYHYMWCYLNATHAVRKALDNTWPYPDWANNPWWQKELNENLSLRTTALLRLLTNFGYAAHEGHSDWKNNFVGPQAAAARFTPWAVLEPENARVISALFQDGRGTSPSYTSDTFPYAGFTRLSTGFSKDDHCLFMHANRPFNITHIKPLNFGLDAYGHILMPIVNRANQLFVDGCPGPDWHTAKNYPEALRADWHRPLYAYRAPGVTYAKTNGMRFHTSKAFDLCEGVHPGPFMKNNRDTSEPETYIDDVTHHRQFLFVRKAGLWILTDRIHSRDQHKFYLPWALAGPDKRAKLSGFNKEQITLDKPGHALHTNNPEMANISIHKYATTPFDMSSRALTFTAKGEQAVVSAIYPRRKGGPNLKSIEALECPDGVTGFAAETADGERIHYQTAAKGTAKLKIGEFEADAEALLLVDNPDDKTVEGVVLGCKALKNAGRRITVTHADFEFTGSGKNLRVTKIHRPMEQVEISPVADTFNDECVITLAHHLGDQVRIHYTLDGTDVNDSSPVYTGPLTIHNTTMVKARAIRKGTDHFPETLASTHTSTQAYALFTRSPYTKPTYEMRGWPKPSDDNYANLLERELESGGLDYAYYEGDWTFSPLIVASQKPVKLGRKVPLLDTSARTRQPDHNYAFVYEGFLKIPRDGVYSFHSPREYEEISIDAGYDLRLYVDGQEWYPATRRHNFGVWSVPLKKGMHAFRVQFTDMRPGDRHKPPQVRNDDLKYKVWQGDKPEIQISGPGLKKQAIPDDMLFCRRFAAGKNGYRGMPFESCVLAYESEPTNVKSPPRHIKLSVKGVKRLALLVNQVGRSRINFAIWGEPKLIRKDGSVVHLSKLQLSKRTGQPAKGAFRIGDRLYENSLGVSPWTTDLVYELNGEYERFEAWVGVDAREKREDYFAVFKVLFERPTGRQKSSALK